MVNLFFQIVLWFKYADNEPLGFSLPKVSILAEKSFCTKFSVSSFLGLLPCLDTYSIPLTDIYPWSILWIFVKITRLHYGVKELSLMTGIWKTGCQHTDVPYPFHNNQLQWRRDLRSESQSTRRKLYSIGLGCDVLDIIPKAQKEREREK